MNVCGPHSVLSCRECWPEGWYNGTSEAVARLKAHLGPKPPRFDARDREALAYILRIASKVPEKP